MVFIRRPDEAVIRCVHKVINPFYLSRYLIHEFLGAFTGFICLALYFLTMLVRSGLCKSQSDARKQIEQNAVSVNDRKITDPAAVLTRAQIGSDGAMIKKGKKGFCRVLVK